MHYWKILTVAGVLAASFVGCADTSGGADEDQATGQASPDPLMQEASSARTPLASLAFPTTKETPGVAPWFNVYRPTNLDAKGAPLPVVVWANGGCFRSDFTWAPLYEKWASAGFVVLALNESAQAGALTQTTVKDHGGLIDWVVKQNETAGSPYFGKLDTKRVVAAGNSCGGITALGLAAQDKRVASVFVLSGSSFFFGADAKVMNKITVPIGYVVGGKEDIAGANATADYDILRSDIPAMIVSRSSGDHVKVSTDPTILPEVAKISLDWLDLALYGTPAAATTLTSSTVCTGCQAGTWTLKSKNLAKLSKP
jgi:predicted dienelactone hydrolase